MRSINNLTPREADVLRLLAQGLPNEAIGRQLGISTNTTRHYCCVIYSKLGVRNRTQASLVYANREKS